MLNFFKKRKIKLICFDLDNTLFDYGTAESESESRIAEIVSEMTGEKTIDIVRAFNDSKKKYLHHDISPDKYSRQLWYEEALLKLDIQKKIDCKKLENEYWDYLIPRMKLFPNTIKVLESLKHSGKYKIACLTDSDGSKEIKIRRLRHFDVEKYFDYVITTDDTGKNKPSIENWEYLLKLSRMNGDECMMVGDHPEVDLVSAKRLGFITVWTKEKIPIVVHIKYVDHEINDIGEILDIVKKYS